MCGLIYHFSKCQNYDLIVVIYLCKEKLMSARLLRAGMMSLFNAAVCNFLQKLMKGIKQTLSVATVKASLLLRCGDVELNPGPLGEQHITVIHIMIIYYYYYSGSRITCFHLDGDACGIDMALCETGSREVRTQRVLSSFGSIKFFIKLISFSCGESKLLGGGGGGGGGEIPLSHPLL